MNEKATAYPLAARLACACNCAYGICARDGTYTPPQPYADGAGWRGTPTAISAPEKEYPQDNRINACLIGESDDGIVIAFRGTLPPAWNVSSLEDWWQDIADSEPVPEAPLPGKVHEGFRNALDTIWSDLVSALRSLQKPHDPKPLLITGHSKGGPMASIAAARLKLAEQIAVAGVKTFASPHPGDSDFVRGYPADIEVIRYENHLDLVPFLPPTDAFFDLWKNMHESWKREFCYWLNPVCKVLDAGENWHYQPLGTLRYVTSDGRVVGSDDYHSNSQLRLAEILMALFGLGSVEQTREAMAAGREVKGSESGLSRIGAAHCIACKSDKPAALCAGGYMTGAGGNAICTGG